MGSFGENIKNNNGQRLIDFSIENDLIINSFNISVITNIQQNKEEGTRNP